MLAYAKQHPELAAELTPKRKNYQKPRPLKFQVPGN